MKIPFFNYPDLFKNNKNDLIKIFEDVGNRGAFILQKDLSDFENNLAKYTGAKYAIGVGNATDGLQLSLMAGELESNSEVIISSHTMIATASAINHIGSVPKPIEVGEDLMIDYNEIEKVINDKTRAIMPTHLNGRTCNMDKIQLIADKYNLDIYEDAAQALGSTFRGKSAGTFGIAAAISFYPAKNLGSLGDAGAILTNSDHIYEKILMLRDHGRDPKTGDVKCWGVNSRMDNLQAAFLNFMLSNYDKIVSRRREIAKLYDSELRSIEQIKLPPAPSNGDHFDVFQNYEIQAENRCQLREYLHDCGIGSMIQWSGKAIHQFRNLGFKENCPYTDGLFEKILMIPLNMFISDDDVFEVIKTIKNFYNK